MTELSFLIELLLNHELPKPTKDLIAERIRSVEANMHYAKPLSPMPVNPFTALPVPPAVTQSPSTLAIMVKNGDIPATAIPPPAVIEPVAQLAQTQATATALDYRQKLMAQSKDFSKGYVKKK